MNKFFLLLCLIGNVFMETFAQSVNFKDERRIYLWDVTLSMKGFGGAPNIYDDVIDALEKDIKSINDEDTEIWVVPFQDKILDKWEIRATETQKASLINKIKSFSTKNITYTNISSPMRDVMQSLISPDKRNVLILLTDGIQNAPQHPVKELYDIIREWCAFAEKNDAYAFYVMLTKFAKDQALEKVISESCNIRITSGVNFSHVELYPQEKYKYNIKDDEGKGLALRIERKKNIQIPAGLKIRCYCDPNPYIDINEAVCIDNESLKIKVKHKMPYEKMKFELPQGTNEIIKVYFDVENPIKHPLVELLNRECSLELINKPEKTLKIYVKD